MASTGRVLFGSALAEEAFEIARRRDPSRQGMTTTDIEQAIEAAGDTIRGDNPRSVLSSSLNGAQHLFWRSARATWTWIEPSAAVDPKEGLSGKDLAAEAYRVARQLDPGQRGVHYEDIKAAIQRDTAVRGPNPGQTMLTALGNAPDRFESLGRGMWRWR